MRNLLICLAFSAIACSKDAPQQTDTTAAVETPAPDTAVVWVSKTWEPGQWQVTDRGLGVISFASRKGPPVNRIDTLVFRSEPSADAPAAGYFMMRTDTTGSGWRWGLKAPALDKPNLVEFESGIAAVPMDSTTADRRWVRGLLGSNAGREMIVGWADTRAPGLTRRAWAAYLRRLPIFVLDTTTGAIASSPEGPTQQLPPDDYQLYAMDSVRGRWLKVRVVSPSDRCSTDKTPRTQSTGWIEYLDQKGRPRFFYHTRGC